MTASTHQAIEGADAALNKMLSAVPEGLPPVELRAALCGVMLETWSSNPPTKGELGLAGITACALARLKELERL